MHKVTQKIKCHYFNNALLCPFEELGCMFLHEKSELCKNADLCMKKLCQFSHNEKSENLVKKSRIENNEKIVKTIHLYNCDQCDLTHQNEIEMKTHKSLVHEKRNYSCELCTFTSVDNNKFKEHQSTLHKETETDLVCKRCKSSNVAEIKCIDCSGTCCQLCKSRKKKLELEVKRALNLTLKDSQFICSNCIENRIGSKS